MSAPFAGSRGLRAALFAALFMIPTRVALSANPADLAAAQALFDEGLKLLERGDYAVACPKLEASHRLDPTMSAAYQLGRCFEGSGRTASAWGMYVAAADRAKAKQNDKAEKAARDKAAALEAKLAKLVLTAPAALLRIEGLVIVRDGVEVSAGILEVPVPVDPGNHEIVVRAPGRKSWTRSTHVAGEAVVATVTLPETLEVNESQSTTLSQTAVPRSTAASAATSPTAVAGAEHVESSPRSAATWRTAGWIGAGTGLATMVVGGVVALSAKSAFDDANSHCRGDLCDGAYAAQRNDAFSRGNLATGIFVAGSVLTAAGLSLAILAPRIMESPRTRVAVTPSGILLEGKF